MGSRKKDRVIAPFALLCGSFVFPVVVYAVNSALNGSAAHYRNGAVEWLNIH